MSRRHEPTPFRALLGQLPDMPSAQRRALANLGTMPWPKGATALEIYNLREAYHRRFEAEVARIQAEDRQANP